MKDRIIFLLLPMLFLFSSCKEDLGQDINTPGEGMGHIVITTDLQLKSRATPTDDLTSYFVILDNGVESRILEFPDNGVIPDVEAGDYILTVTSHIDPELPAFDLQHYSGSENVTVTDGKVIPVTVTLTQVNAGIIITYEGFEENETDKFLVRIRTNDGTGILWYYGEEKDLPGYFSPGLVWLSLWEINEEFELRESVSEVPILIQAGELWKVTLFLGTGDLELSVTIFAENMETSELRVIENTVFTPLDQVEQQLFYSDDYDAFEKSYFNLVLSNHANVPSRYELHIDGYADKVSAEEFNITGTYPISSGPGAGKIHHGFLQQDNPDTPLGTYLYEGNGEEKRLWLASHGNARFDLTGGVTTMKFTAIFTEVATGKTEVRTFSYAGELVWTETPSTWLLPDGNCNVTGIPLDDGPVQFESRFLAQVPLLQRWGGEACNVYLTLDKGNLSWMENNPVTGDVGMGLIRDPDTGENVFIRKAPIRIAGKGMLDFTFSYEGQEAAIGVVRTDKITGEILEIVGDFYLDAFLVQEGLKDEGQERNTYRKYNGIQLNSVTGKYELINKNYRIVDFDPEKAGE